MPATYSFTVDTIGQGEAIIMQSTCKRVRLKQNDQSVATLLPFKIMVPLATSPAVRHEAGEQAVIDNLRSDFKAGDTVGYIATFSSSAVFAQIEE